MVINVTFFRGSCVPRRSASGKNRRPTIFRSDGARGSGPEGVGTQRLRGPCLRGELGPALPRIDGSQQELEKRDMPSQDALGPTRFQRMKEGRLVEETQALFQPSRS